MSIYTALRHRRITTTRTFLSLSSKPPPSPPPKPKSSKPTLLYQHPTPNSPNQSPLTHVQLLTFGRGSSGQLGLPAQHTLLYPTPVSTLLLPPSFSLAPSPGSLGRPLSPSQGLEVGISCGLFHSAVLIDGQFWAWGKGDGGRLGFGHEDPVFVPTLNDKLAEVRSLALGGLHSLALTKSGQVFSWGYGGFGALGHSVFTRELVPRLVEGPWTREIKHIATSGTHTAAISESGELYTWGREEGDGRLGLGPGRGPDQTGGLSVPCKVKALPVPVVAAACGGFFTLALTEEGKVWSWGANSNNELGRGDKVGGWQPKQISLLQDLRIIQVACGGYHSLALTDDGEVLSWGHGGHGQLGHSSRQNQKEPMFVEALRHERISSVACGGSTSAAVTESGKLFMWGCAKDSQLGIPGLPDIQPSPVEVKFLTEDDSLGPHKVLSVAIGACHSMCLVSRSSS